MNSPEDDEVEKVDSISLDSLPIEVNVRYEIVTVTTIYRSTLIFTSNFGYFNNLYFQNLSINSDLVFFIKLETTMSY